jgi:hypothetical protein
MKDLRDEYYYPVESAFGVPAALLGPPDAEERARQQEERAREEVRRRQRAVVEALWPSVRR